MPKSSWLAPTCSVRTDRMPGGFQSGSSMRDSSARESKLLSE